MGLSPLTLVRGFAGGQLPEDIAWHYIGTLQSNKCKMLACEYRSAIRLSAD